MYLFDTDFLINLAKGDKGALNFARKVEREMAFRAISVVTVHEYLLGTYFSYFKRKNKLNKMLKKGGIRSYEIRNNSLYIGSLKNPRKLKHF